MSISIIYHNGNIWGILASERAQPGKSETLLDDAGLPGNIRIHDLRHAVAVDWIARGTPVDVVAQRLGHADPGFTMRVYGHVQITQQQAPADERGAALLGDELL